jgi:anaerobic selenocysteine-containing dehydrogenase
MERRAFITLTAITGTAALTGCADPIAQVTRFVPEETLVPGIEQWKPSVCPACASGCGVLVRVMEGDAEVQRGEVRGVIKMGLAKKLEGHPAHPVNHGRLCARGQAALQIPYHPDRLTQPLKRSGPRGSGQFQAVTWDEAVGELVQRLDALRTANQTHGLGFLTPRRSSVRDDLIAVFLERFGAPPPIVCELFSDDVLREANRLSFGHAQLPTFDLARARFVLAFGADFLATWNSPVSQSLAYGEMRQGRAGIRARFVQVEPRMSQTGANADEWVPTRPGTEGVLALGLAHVLIAEHLRPSAAAGRAGALIDGWAAGLPAYTPDQVAANTGVAAARIQRLAREMAEERPAVALIGGAPLAQTNGLFQALAVNALNALLGSIDQPGGVSFTPRLAHATSSRRLVAALRDPLQLLLVDDTNPVFASPAAWKVRDALSKVPFIASFASFVDETSVLADLILPDHAFLESWIDRRPESGAAIAVATVAAPALRPLHDTRATPDVLLEISRRLQRPLPLPWKSFEEMLQAHVAALARSKDEADDLWNLAKKQGGVWAGLKTVPSEAPVANTFVHPPPDAQFDGDPAAYPFHFLPYPSSLFYDGALAHLPWLQELPDPITTAMWSSWLEINPQTARRLQIGEGDLVEVRSAYGVVRAPALISPGTAPDVIAMPVGQGHDTFTRYASGRGVNPVALLAPSIEPATGALAWAATRVAVSRVGGADGSLILFAGSKTEHPEHDRG